MTERSQDRQTIGGASLPPRLGAAIAALLAAASVVGAAQPLPAELAARTGKPLPAPAVSSVATSEYGMAATASPEATAAAVAILEAGGNAIDAAVAAAFTVGVADLDSSGLGGMTYAVIRLADGRSVAIDGTPPTPLAVDPERLRSLPRGERLFGHEMAAVPTTLAALEMARERYGSMTLARLIAPAIAVAERGYRLNPSQIVWSNVYFELLLRSGYLRLIALDDGSLVGRPADEDAAIGRPGDLRCRPELAATLRLIQERGVGVFYRGEIADRIDADMVAHGGFVRKADLAMLRVREVPALQAAYRGFRVITFPAPGGGPAVIGALRILESFSSALVAERSTWRHQVLLEATRIAYATRSSPDRIAFPRPGAAGSAPYEDDLASLITPGVPIADAALRGPVPPGCEPPGESTTQISVADSQGNVVSLTQTLGRSFGAKVATPGLGFPYNSLLEGFNVDRPQCPGYLQPRRPCPTDMAPTIVLRPDGSLLAALGAPGSSRIPAILTGVISNLVDHGLGLVEAVEAPRLLCAGLAKNGAIIEVADDRDAELADALEAMGFAELERLTMPPTSRRIILVGGLNAVGWDAVRGQFVGVGDGRRWGAARGPEVVAGSAVAP